MGPISSRCSQTPFNYMNATSCHGVGRPNLNDTAHTFWTASASVKWRSVEFSTTSLFLACLFIPFVISIPYIPLVQLFHSQRASVHHSNQRRSGPILHRNRQPFHLYGPLSVPHRPMTSNLITDAVNIEALRAPQYLSAAGLVVRILIPCTTSRRFGFKIDDKDSPMGPPLTFQDEVQLIWQTKLSVPKVLFLFSRHAVPIAMIVQTRLNC
ncbi:hypothetical protein PAXRUDRAFT_362844 [Paxillus rubicundulus Ve08.2h10]|uniref:DUF6533 domain-containing protein n=1 Tax=Paxillus rubicundulus Ve08.2h10 TaxID=930991 RepID=A0A0D0DRL7_9AGAM|nr:hypothetical protein PAXRUDRAFT_362844 [Paxillus rubicundulus Ve08.2h10]